MQDEERLERIETKIGFSEDLLEALNETVYRQQRQIEQLQAQIAQLSERIRHLPAGGGGRDPRDEIPPHY